MATRIKQLFSKYSHLKLIYNVSWVLTVAISGNAGFEKQGRHPTTTNVIRHNGRCTGYHRWRQEQLRTNVIVDINKCFSLQEIAWKFVKFSSNQRKYWLKSEMTLPCNNFPSPDVKIIQVSHNQGNMLGQDFNSLKIV